MFCLSDFKVSISSLEFSLFFQQSCPLCSNCGQLLDNRALSEVRFSSLVLLLGVGSLVYYKWIKERNKNKNKKRRLSLGLANIRRYRVMTSTPFIDLCGSIDSKTSIASSDGSDLGFNLTDISDENESSVRTPSLQMIGNQTVAKLDELLDQIQDIKRSVYEIDEQIFDVKESNVKFEPKMFSLRPEMSSSLTNGSDLNEGFNYFNTEPQTPTLEWDLTDLNAFNGSNDLNAMNAQNNSLINENQLLSPLNSSYLRHQSFDHLIRNYEKAVNVELNQLDSPQDLSSPSNSTSGEFSITSASEQIKDNNLATIEAMITDAKKLGLLKHLIEALIKCSKRDSAYFED